jgi:hypothetical protein
MFGNATIMNTLVTRVFVQFFLRLNPPKWLFYYAKDLDDALDWVYKNRENAAVEYAD